MVRYLDKADGDNPSNVSSTQILSFNVYCNAQNTAGNWAGYKTSSKCFAEHFSIAFIIRKNNILIILAIAIDISFAYVSLI